MSIHPNGLKAVVLLAIGKQLRINQLTLIVSAQLTKKKYYVSEVCLAALSNEHFRMKPPSLGVLNRLCSTGII